jgi:membrane-bound serine protease (ClpP class)
VVLIVLFFKFVFPRISGVISGPYLSTTLAEAHSTSELSLPLAVGDKGVVIKTLRPTGSAKIGDTIYDVITDGEFIDKDEDIIVTEIKGNRILVIRSSDNDQ